MTDPAYKRKIVEYLKKNLAKGYIMEALKWALVKQGYSKVLVDEAIRITNKELAEKAPILKEKPVIKYEVIGENNKSVEIKKPWWKKLFGIK